MACAGMFFARTGHTHGPLGGSVHVFFLVSVHGLAVDSPSISFTSNHEPLL